jgi:hypothetical protein
MPLPRLRDVPIFLFNGFLSFTLYNITLITGQKTVPAGTSSVIIALNPVIVALLAGLVLNEKLNRNGIIGIFIAFIGWSLPLSLETWINPHKGVFWILIASLSASTSTILQKKRIARYSGEQVMTYSYLGRNAFIAFLFTRFGSFASEYFDQSDFDALYSGRFPRRDRLFGMGILLSKFPRIRQTVFFYGYNRCNVNRLACFRRSSGYSSIVRIYLNIDRAFSG